MIELPDVLKAYPRSCLSEGRFFVVRASEIVIVFVSRLLFLVTCGIINEKDILGDKMSFDYKEHLQ